MPERERFSLTTGEVAEQAGVGIATIRRWADQGFLPSWKTPYGVRRFRPSDVKRFLASQHNGEAS